MAGLKVDKGTGILRLRAFFIAINGILLLASQGNFPAIMASNQHCLKVPRWQHGFCARLRDNASCDPYCVSFGQVSKIEGGPWPESFKGTGEFSGRHSGSWIS